MAPSPRRCRASGAVWGSGAVHPRGHPHAMRGASSSWGQARWRASTNVPIGPELRNRFPSNWELSTARAADVVRYLVAQGVNPNILSAQGFGDSRPVASNDAAQGRAKNRRVEIVIMAAGS